MPGMIRKGGWNVPGTSFEVREGTRPMTGGGRDSCRRTGDAAAPGRGIYQGGGRGQGICRGQGGGRWLGLGGMVGGAAPGTEGFTSGGSAAEGGQPPGQGAASQRALEAIKDAVRQLEETNRKREGEG